MPNTLQLLYNSHKQGLFMLALSITHSPPDAEDALHDAFTRLLHAKNQLPPDPAPYLFATVRNAAIDRLRARSPQSSPLSSSLTACLDSTNHAITKERDHAIAAAIDSLPENLRETVLLRVFSTLTFRQIAELTTNPLPTVVSRYNAALEQLRPQLRKLL